MDFEEFHTHPVNGWGELCGECFEEVNAGLQRCENGVHCTGTINFRPQDIHPPIRGNPNEEKRTTLCSPCFLQWLRSRGLTACTVCQAVHALCARCHHSLCSQHHQRHCPVFK